MRAWALVLVTACGKDAKAPPQPAAARPVPVPVVADAAPAPLPPGTYADVAAALAAIVPADARVIGFGELHSRTDRAQVTSTLAHFTKEVVPAIGDKLSDLVLETWIVDPHCGSAAQVATAKIETEVKRPEATKSEIGTLAETARKAGIQPHAMRLTCDDYARVAPPGKDVNTEEMLTLTTRELARISSEAVAHRDAEAQHRPWIAVYGGAMHNDRFPAKGVEDWSYAAKADAVSKDHFVEIDLIVPELAEPDPASQKQPWFDLVTAAKDKVSVFKRGERSFVVVLPRSTP